jgi:hypothetical protein
LGTEAGEAVTGGVKASDARVDRYAWRWDVSRAMAREDPYAGREWGRASGGNGGGVGGGKRGVDIDEMNTLFYVLWISSSSRARKGKLGDWKRRAGR